MFIFTIQLIFIISIIVYIYYYLKTYRQRRFFQQFVSPPRLPIIGNALDFKSTKDVLNILHRYRQQYGNLITMKIGLFDYTLIVSDYQFFEFILTTNRILKKSDIYKFLLPWLGNGLLTSSGQIWRSHRKLITPAFHFRILEEFVNIFNSNGDLLIDKLKQNDGAKSLDIYPFITLCALDIICESAMGVKVNAQEDKNSPYVRSVKEMTRIIIDRNLSPITNKSFFFIFTRDYIKQWRALRILHNYTNQVIDKKIKENRMKYFNQIETNDGGNGQKKRQAFLNLLLESRIDGRPLTKSEIREEVDTFMFEGHDTTASAITFTIYNLAYHKQIQDKVYDEQLNLFGNDKNPNITYQDLQNMHYLDLVIKEVLRLYPSVPIIGRQTDEDVDYKGITIPKGVNIALFLQGIHKDPKYFPDPEKFDPSRFENSHTPPYSYLPFSAGYRNCIGQKFAILEIKSLISKIIRNFELSPADPEHKLEIVAETILKSKNGVRVGLKTRK